VTTEELLANFDASLKAVESYGFKLATWKEFENASDRPDGLLERAQKYASPDCQVIYDPLSDDDGWLLVGDKQEIVKETAAHLIDLEPPTGPLSAKELAA